MVIKGRFSKKPPKLVIKIPTNYNPFIDNIAALKRKPLQQDATNLLFEIANMVGPIMKEYGYTVKNLNEMSPKANDLLGLNVNHGEKIFLRLRPFHNDLIFFTKEQLIETMLHELVHNKYSKHDKKFYNHLDELSSKQKTYMMKGIDGKSIKNPFQGEGIRLGGRSIINVHEKRLKKLTKSYISGTHILGGEYKKGNLKDFVREAAIKRFEDNKWCNKNQEKDLPKNEDLIIINDDEFVIEKKRSEEMQEKKKRPNPVREVIILDDDVIVVDDDDIYDIDDIDDIDDTKGKDINYNELETIDLT